MCLSCIDIVSFLPLIWVISMPVVGAFCGPDTVLRFSLLMLMYSSLGSCVQRFVKSLLPLFSIGFFVVILCLPVSVVPYPLVWLYGHLLWVSEPAMLLAEAVGVVEITVQLSKRASDHVDDNPLLAKGMILGVTGLAYMASVCLAVYTYWIGTPAVRGLLFVVILISMAHLVLTVWFDQGIVSNSAVVAVCMLGAVCVGFYETDLLNHPLPEPREWADESMDVKSLVQMLLSAASSSLSHVTKATRFLSKLVSPVLVTLIVVRAASMLCILHWMMGRLKEYILYDEDDDVEDEDDVEEVEMDNACSCLPAPPSGLGLVSLPTTLALIFIYTQLVYRTMALSGGHAPFRAYLPAAFQGLLFGEGALLSEGGAPLSGVGLLRLGQLSVLTVFYPLRLVGEGRGDND